MKGNVILCVLAIIYGAGYVNAETDFAHGRFFQIDSKTTQYTNIDWPASFNIFNEKFFDQKLREVKNKFSIF